MLIKFQDGLGSLIFCGGNNHLSYSRGEWEGGGSRQFSEILERHILFSSFCLVSCFNAFRSILSNDKIPDDMVGPLDLLIILGV